MSTPTIASEIGDFKNLISHKKNGILVKENTMSEWLELLNWAYNNQDKLADIATQAHHMTTEQFMTDSYSPEHVNEEIFTYAFN
jgi:glycosyltransferase involved in cell wall biosynthesis